MTEKTYRDRPYNRILGRLRLLATFTLVAVLLYLASPTPLSVLFGTIVVALGEGVRLWAAGHLLKTTELVTGGPYRYTRNPLYLGRLLIFTGLCVGATLPWGTNWWVLGANWWVLVVGWVVFFGYYLRRKERVEPERLRRFHGDAYERYFQAVPALFPALRPYAEGADAKWSAKRMLRNREQWMVVVLLAVSLFLLWRSLA
ncbi:MAG: isoprenylcysteine carboxylmethyltransferase family protein [bacterium]|nr:isoprenylcysteine carboxylmethyltransferase family protein [bacterium]